MHEMLHISSIYRVQSKYGFAIRIDVHIYEVVQCLFSHFEALVRWGRLRRELLIFFRRLLLWLLGKRVNGHNVAQRRADGHVSNWRLMNLCRACNSANITPAKGRVEIELSKSIYDLNN